MRKNTYKKPAVDFISFATESIMENGDTLNNGSGGFGIDTNPSGGTNPPIDAGDWD